MSNLIFNKTWRDPQTGKLKRHVYLLDGKPLQGVTRVLGIIAKNLTPWAGRVDARQAFIAASQLTRDRLELLRQALEPHQNITAEQAEAIGKDYPEYDEARSAHDEIRDKAADGGKDVHAEIESWVGICIAESGGLPTKVPTTASEQLRDFAAWSIKNQIRFLASEKVMACGEWAVAGTADLIFEKDGKTYVGDAKTHKKLWDNVPFIQCAAYARMYEETEGKKIDGTCVILLPKGGILEEHYRFDLENDIKAFESALNLYRTV